MSQLQVNQFAHDSGYQTSGRYSAINTANLVAQFEANGFVLHKTSAARVRQPERQGYQKHLFTFRHADLQLRGVGDSVPQIILKNSYDGTSSLQIMLGVYRLVCANGLLVGSSFETHRVRHVGPDAVSLAVQAALSVSRQTDAVADIIMQMKARQLSDAEANYFSERAAALIAPSNATIVQPASLLQARRAADVNSDVWSVYNRVQENVIRGGLLYTSVDGAGRTRARRRRGVQAIDANVKLNKALWTIAEHFVAKGA